MIAIVTETPWGGKGKKRAAATISDAGVSPTTACSISPKGGTCESRSDGADACEPRPCLLPGALPAGVKPNGSTSLRNPKQCTVHPRASVSSSQKIARAICERLRRLPRSRQDFPIPRASTSAAASGDNAGRIDGLRREHIVTTAERRRGGSSGAARLRRRCRFPLRAWPAKSRSAA